jgi:hypothetical protein
MLIAIVLMAVIAAVVIVRLPDFASTDAKVAASIMQQFKFASEHAMLTARPVEVQVSGRELVFNEFYAGRWSQIEGTGVSLGMAERLVMFNVVDDRRGVAAQRRLRVDEVGRWPLVDLELYRGSRQVRTFRVGD